ncbi:MAG: hypothetical protein EOO20_05385 [Chryseobacterium sp.]|nr:MAG: hypothetical protein EOO20_05385 [Chryseobacterium sp.]
MEKFTTMNWIIFSGLLVFGFVGTVYTLYQYVQTVRGEAELKAAQKETFYLQNEALKLALGEGRPIVSILATSETDFLFTIISESNYPIYDVSLSICDFDKIVKCFGGWSDGKYIVDKECVTPNVFTYPDFNLKSNTAHNTDIIFSFDENIRHFTFKIHARNGITIYQSAFQKLTSGEIIHHYRRFILKEGKYEAMGIEGDLAKDEVYWMKHFFPTVDFSTGIINKKYR